MRSFWGEEEEEDEKNLAMVLCIQQDALAKFVILEIREH